MRKLALSLPVVAVGVGSAFAQGDANPPDVSSAFTQLTGSLNSVASSLTGVRTAVIAIAIGVSVIVVSRAVIKRFLKL